MAMTDAERSCRYRLQHPDRVRRQRRRYKQRLKQEAFAKLGGKCAWPGCNICDPKKLQIDHIQPLLRGKKWRNRNTLLQSCAEIARMADPWTKFQLLCARHHYEKTMKEWQTGAYRQRAFNLSEPMPQLDLPL